MSLKSSLKTVFNCVSLPLYAANEVMQKLHIAGIHVYSHIPHGTFVRNYASDLFGAAAIVHALHLNLRDVTPEWVPGHQILINNSEEIALGVSAVVLTSWELMKHNAHFDWGNMVSYAIAFACHYALNKENMTQQRPSPDLSKPVPENDKAGCARFKETQTFTFTV